MMIVCVCDFSQNQEYIQFDANDTDIQKLPTIKNGLHYTEASKSLPVATTKTTLKRVRLIVDGISAFYLLRELKNFTGLRRWLCTSPALQGLQLLWIELVPPKKEIIDYKWNHMVARSLWEHIEMENMMSWLSTLGGGFSALGEQFSRCAETAGKISLKQLSVGIRLGDPFLQARCKLYYSISLIQTGRLRCAKYLIRQQYEFAKQYKEVDKRLIKMCKGIWLRLQYEYGLRLEARRKKQLLGA